MIILELRHYPAYRATLLLNLRPSHEIVRGMLNIWVEQLAPPISNWYEAVGRFVGTVGTVGRFVGNAQRKLILGDVWSILSRSLHC
jgi:hypothetical protein